MRWVQEKVEGDGNLIFDGKKYRIMSYMHALAPLEARAIGAAVAATDLPLTGLARDGEDDVDYDMDDDETEGDLDDDEEEKTDDDDEDSQ